MRRQASPPAPRKVGPITRAAFDRVFDRYVDSLWNTLAPHAATPAVADRVERIMTQIAFRWAEGVREPELDLLALELVRREEKDLLEGASDASSEEAAS